MKAILKEKNSFKDLKSFLKGQELKLLLLRTSPNYQMMKIMKKIIQLFLVLSMNFKLSKMENK